MQSLKRNNSKHRWRSVSLVLFISAALLLEGAAVSFASTAEPEAPSEQSTEQADPISIPQGPQDEVQEDPSLTDESINEVDGDNEEVLPESKQTIEPESENDVQEEVFDTSAPVISGTSYVHTGTISWEPIEGADGYILYKLNSLGVYQEIGDYSADTLSADVELSSQKNVSYTFKLNAYKKDDEERLMGNDSNDLSLEAAKLTLGAGTTTANNIVYTVKTDTKVCLKWNGVPGATGYALYEYIPNGQDVLKNSTIPTKTQCTLTSLQPYSTHMYYVRAYDETGMGPVSDIFTTTTYDRTNGYFASNIFEKRFWPGIWMTTRQQGSLNMDDYHIIGSEQVYGSDRDVAFDRFGPIQFNYAAGEKVLYIHVYTKVIGPRANDAFELYTYQNGKYVKTKTTSTTYKNLVIQTLRDYYNVPITGNQYNFAPGVNFNTKVVLHTGSDNSDQQFINIIVGDGSGQGKINGNYWHFADGYHVGRDNDTLYACSVSKNIHLATNDLLALNKNAYQTRYCPEVDFAAFRSVVAHEFGHTLGLADAYTHNNVVRGVQNTEVGPLMFGERSAKPNANDIDMIIQAHNHSIRNQAYSYQAYGTYQLAAKFRKSLVIKL